MDLNDVETIDFNALGGADNITVNDLSGTDVDAGRDRPRSALRRLGRRRRGRHRHRQRHERRRRQRGLRSPGASVTVAGFAATVTISHAEAERPPCPQWPLAATTSSTRRAGAGLVAAHNRWRRSATMCSSAAPAPTRCTAATGTTHDGNGRQRCSAPATTCSSWNPGDGNDTVEGQAGADTLDFRGANVAENIDIAANGGRVRFVRDIASVTMDLNDVETIQFRALGGVDTVTVHDMSGTDLALVAIDLDGPLASGIGDLTVDNIFVEGSAGGNTVQVSSTGGVVSVTGLAVTTTLFSCRGGRHAHRSRARRR